MLSIQLREVQHARLLKFREIMLIIITIIIKTMTPCHGSFVSRATQHFFELSDQISFQTKMHYDDGSHDNFINISHEIIEQVSQIRKVTCKWYNYKKVSMLVHIAFCCTIIISYKCIDIY